MIATNSVSADFPGYWLDELVTTLLDTANVCIERIVSLGHASPEGVWYDQLQHERVVVLKGAARPSFEDGTVELKPGDFANIPTGRHRTSRPYGLPCMTQMRLVRVNTLGGRLPSLLRSQPPIF